MARSVGRTGSVLKAVELTEAQHTPDPRVVKAHLKSVILTMISSVPAVVWASTQKLEDGAAARAMQS